MFSPSHVINSEATNLRKPVVVAKLSSLFFVILLVVPCAAMPVSAREGKASEILYWGQKPDENKIRQLKTLGIKSLICARTNPMLKEKALAESLGMKWYHVKTGVMHRPKKAEMAKFLSIIGDRKNQPAYVFCVGGRDRTSFYIGLYRVAFEGWSTKQVRVELREHKLRRKWPVFWFYDDVLDDNRAWIKNFVAQHKFQHVATQSNTSRPCPCSDINYSRMNTASKQQQAEPPASGPAREKSAN